MVVKSNNIFSPQNYLEAVTGQCYVLNNDESILFQIVSLLKQHNYPSENYLLTDTSKMIETGKQFVLVDCCDIGENFELINEHRWFIAPENVA